MQKYEDFCTYHPQHPITMICLNDRIFPQRKICCQCLTSCDTMGEIKQNELITIEELYQKLEQQSNKIIDLQKKEKQIFESFSKQVKQECQCIPGNKTFSQILQEIKNLLQEGPRPLTYSELKFYSNILIYDFKQNYKIIDDLKKSLDSASKTILNVVKKYKENSSINIQVNVKKDKQYDKSQIKVTLPIHKKIEDLIQEFGEKDDQIYQNGEEINNLNTTLFENNIWSNDKIIIKNNKISITLIDKQKQEINFLLLPSETILTIKKLVQQKEGIEPSQQKIIYYGRVLQDFEKLLDIKYSNPIFLLDINKTVINLFSMDEKPQKIYLNPNFTFENTIHQIQSQIDIPYTIISSISINNNPLTENQQIQNLVYFETQAIITIKLSRPVILAKTLSGKIIIINPNENNTIPYIKQQIENEYNIPISHQYIYHKMNLIDNSKSLTEIGIRQLDFLKVKCNLDKEKTLTQPTSIIPNKIKNLIGVLFNTSFQ